MIAVGIEPVAKKKSARKVDMSKWESKPIIIAMRGSVEFKAWVEAFAHKNRMTVAQLVERCLALQAERDGMDTPPPR